MSERGCHFDLHQADESRCITNENISFGSQPLQTLFVAVENDIAALCTTLDEYKLRVTFLTMNHRMLSWSEMSAVAWVLMQCKHLTHLDLQHGELSCGNARILANVLSKMQHLRVLNLGWSHADDNALTVLQPALMRCKHLTHLDVSFNNLSQRLLRELRDAFAAAAINVLITHRFNSNKSDAVDPLVQQPFRMSPAPLLMWASPVHPMFGPEVDKLLATCMLVLMRYNVCDADLQQETLQYCSRETFYVAPSVAPFGLVIQYPHASHLPPCMED